MFYAPVSYLITLVNRTFPLAPDTDAKHPWSRLINTTPLNRRLATLTNVQGMVCYHTPTGSRHHRWNERLFCCWSSRDPCLHSCRRGRTAGAKLSPGWNDGEALDWIARVHGGLMHWGLPGFVWISWFACTLSFCSITGLLNVSYGRREVMRGSLRYCVK